MGFSQELDLTSVILYTRRTKSLTPKNREMIDITFIFGPSKKQSSRKLRFLLTELKKALPTSENVE